MRGFIASQRSEREQVGHPIRFLHQSILLFKLEQSVLPSQQPEVTASDGSWSTAPQTCKDERGVTYLALMCAIVLMGISLTAVGQYWQVIAKRDAEAELYFRGTRIKHAIEAYAADYEVRKGARPNQYPLNLEQLTQGPKRYLPVVYTDPLTGQDFELIRVNGEIRGIRSRSSETPLDKVRFKDAAAYNQIAFQAIPPSPPGQPCGSDVNRMDPLNPLVAGPCAVASAPSTWP